MRRACAAPRLGSVRASGGALGGFGGWVAGPAGSEVVADVVAQRWWSGLDPSAAWAGEGQPDHRVTGDLPAAFVHEPVVEPAQRDEVRFFGRATVTGPPGDVMRVQER